MLRTLAPLTVTALLVPLLGAAPASADHAAPPETVTLVGSLQSELGCEADWAPGCAATGLTR